MKLAYQMAEIALEKGLNVIVGPNEAGKSTIYNSIQILGELQKHDVLKVGKRTNEALTNL